ncbi:ARMC8 [Cordylochernes scorpioides]|uniref:ARMC8 n=1 Tax=Cordylochernes scorpioides TaxID=51811 RepID=A0ABY6KXV5_9ARAC|nr:ARMC8 [Cordylochernes scorpioides]
MQRKDCTTLEQRAVIRFLNAEGIQTSHICQRMKNIYVLEHPAYSPDLAPSDYFLFGLLKKELKGKRFDSDEDVQKVVQDFFHTLPKSANKEGIYKLPERWRRCIESQELINEFDDVLANVQMWGVCRLLNLMMDEGSSPELTHELVVTLGSLAQGTEENVKGILNMGTFAILLQGAKLHFGQVGSQRSAGKVLLTIFWDVDGPICLDFLSSRQRMNNDLYCDILVNKLKPGIRNKRRGKLSKVLEHTHTHPAYSPDLAPSDSFLFGLLKKELKGKRFDSDEDIQKVVQDFFHTLPKSAYKEGIYKLPEHWRRCIESQGKGVQSSYFQLTHVERAGGLTYNGWPAVMFHPDEKVVEACLRCLRTLCLSPYAPVEELFERENVLKYLLERGQGRSMSNQECVATILACASKDAEKQNLLCSHGAVDFLFNLLHSPVYKVQLPALKCLGHLCYDNEKVASIIVSANYNCKSLPDYLVELMGRDKTSEMQLAAAKW